MKFYNYKKKIVAGFLCFMLLVNMFAGFKTVSASTSEEKISVLFIGNSFTKYGQVSYGVPSILGEMAKATGKKINCTTIRQPAAHMTYYAYPTIKYPSYYKEVSLAIMNSQWDYIVLQDMSTNGVSNAENEMYPAIRTINDLVLRYQEKAKVLLYSTFAFDNGTEIEYNGVNQKLTIEQFQHETAKAYNELGRELGVDVVPVGMMFLHCNKMYPDINLYSEDSKHASYIGYHIAAATFYNYFFNEAPVVTNQDLKYSDVSDEVLKKVNALVDDKITIDSTYKEIGVGESFSLTHKIIEDEGSKQSDKVDYFIMNNEIIEGNKSGDFTAVAEGKTAIIVQTKSGVQAICQVNVTSHKNAQLLFNRTYYQIGKGDTIRITPTTTKHIDMFDYTWRAYNKKVAKVGYDGMVVSFMPGRTYIKITKKSNSNITARYMLYVQCPTPKNVEAVNLYPGDKNDPTAINQIMWSKVYGATSYRIYRSENSKTGFELIATTSKNSYFDLKARTGVTSYYRIVATAGYNATDSEISQTAKTYAVGIPVITEVKSSKKNTTITWNKDNHASSYILYRKKAGEKYKKIAVINNKDVTKYVDKQTNSKRKRYYKIVTVINQDDDTIYSDDSVAVSN